MSIYETNLAVLYAHHPDLKNKRFESDDLVIEILDTPSGCPTARIESTYIHSKYDPYREALVVEQVTIWPDQFADLDPADRKRLEERLHAEPQHAAEMAYVRLHTGFSRQITVAPEDVERLRSQGGSQ